MNRILIGLLLLLATPVLAMSLRDPTSPQPYQAENVAPSGIEGLSAIFMGHNKRLAIIDGNLLQEGDRFDGYDIVSITADALVVSKDGVFKTISLAPDPIRQPLTVVSAPNS